MASPKRKVKVDPKSYFVGDIGTSLGVTVVDETGAPVALASATTREIRFLGPNGISFTKTAELATDGSDGRMHYQVQAGFLVAGKWERQGHVVTPGGEWWTQIVEFHVFETLPAPA